MEDLKVFGVQQMDSKELKETDGGVLGVMAVLTVAYGAGYLVGKLIKGKGKKNKK
ncbi:hypothetical protein [Marinifilum flexuosum]|uniref:hypothetical protein n=1 Tax=Marinifilum flexuosum TaxID=1117708 RepID=UPI002490E0D2|nr:hypothetical protein [Marinifilum flexuosum]